MSKFENWEKDILNPVLVNIFTACIIFMVALIFKPVRIWMFPPEVIPEYPLLCTAEPYIMDSTGELTVAFFVINRTDDEYNREKLALFLKNNNPNPEGSLSPDIELIFWREVGEFGKPYIEEEFNKDKGYLVPSKDETKNAVKIIIGLIKPRAVMKVTIPIADAPDAGASSIKRTDRVAIPFNFDHYEKACYSR